MSGTPAHAAWLRMRSQCKTRGEALYGPWRAFEVFRRDLGPRPDGAVLRRYDETKPWGPDNACWAQWDPKTQTAVLPERKTPTHAEREAMFDELVVLSEEMGGYDELKSDKNDKGE